MEKWLLDNLLQMIVIGIGGFVAFVKLSRFQSDSLKWREEYGKLLEKFENNLARHIESSMPHAACPAHNAILQEIRGLLTHIQQHTQTQEARIFGMIDELERRLFDIVKQGTN